MSAATLRSLVLIAVCAALAPLIANMLARWMPVSTTVLEIIFGILIGPAVLGWARSDEFIDNMSNFGLVLLFFLAGYEIDFGRIRGRPVTAAVLSWCGSLVLGLGCGYLIGHLVGAKAHGGFTIGLALATTALGAILPILRDAGLLPTALGAHTMAAGAIGEFAPLVAVAVLLSGRAPGRALVVLAVFAVAAVCAALLAMRPKPPRIGRVLSGTLTSSGQFGVRLVMLVVLLLAWLAIKLELDLILGAFASGVIVALLLDAIDPSEHDREILESKLDGLAFGLFIPLFFVVTGIKFDLRALLSSASALALVPLGLIAFLLVRGLPVAVAFRGLSTGPERRALALYASTALPLVVVITGIGVDNGWLTNATAAGLVGAAMLSVLLYPLLALRAVPAVTGGAEP